jgi:DNA transformation protein and related proteins
LDPEFIRDLFSQFRPVAVRRMFSGAGIFAEGLMFGLIVDAAIYLKVDETNISDFEREGSQPFTYTRGKKLRPADAPRATLLAPAGAVWAGRAFAIAERKRLAPRTRAKRKPSSKRK